MRISDWSSDVCSSDLRGDDHRLAPGQAFRALVGIAEGAPRHREPVDPRLELARNTEIVNRRAEHDPIGGKEFIKRRLARSEERRVGKGGVSKCNTRTCQCYEKKNRINNYNRQR